jgi:hypothetical protein
LRLILNLLLICVIAAGVGLGLTALSVRHPLSLNVIKDGAWRAIGNEGAPDIDAYALAALAHRGEAPLAISEGLTFRAREDDDGNVLTGSCSYVISGTVPNVRAWSIAAFDDKGRRFANPAQRFGYSNADALRNADGAIRIGVSAQARPGDWIPVQSKGKIVLILRLYDTTAAAIAGGRSAPELPAITRIGCVS